MNKAEKAVEQAKLRRERAVLKDLEAHYEYALQGINERLQVLQAAPETQSNVYRISYQKVMRQQVSAILENLRANTYTTLDQYMHDAYTTGYVGAMYSLHNQDVPLLIPINQDAVLKAVQHDTKLKEPLYASLGIDTAQMKKGINRELSRGLASGLTYDEIARNIKQTTKAPLARAKTIARTEGHRIHEESSQDAAVAAKAEGADIVKQWDSTLDGDTRPNHRQLDGQIRELEEPFEVGTFKPMHPGDFGTAKEDCNCRCVSLHRARWALDEAELEEMKERAKQFGLDKSAEFADFEKKYLKAAEELTPKKIETRKQAVEAIENSGFTLVGHGVEFMPDEQVIVAAQRLDELETRFGCAKDGNYSLEAPVLKGKDKKTIAHVRNTKTTGAELVLNAEYYSKPVETLVKHESHAVSTDFSMPCAEEHLKHYTITHEYGHMLEAMVYKKRNGVSVSDLDIGKRKAIVAEFEKDIWGEIKGIAKERNPYFKVTKSTISEYGRTNHAEAFAETFANALCGKPNELGDAMIVWLERNGF